MEELSNAVRESIRSYYDDKAWGKSSTLQKVKYTKEYFDTFEKGDEEIDEEDVAPEVEEMNDEE